MRDGRLTIKAERSEKKETKGRSEFRYGSFVRSVTLPAGANEDDIKATYDKGILTVSVAVPKRRIGRETHRSAERKLTSAAGPQLILSPSRPTSYWSRAASHPARMPGSPVPGRWLIGHRGTSSLKGDGRRRGDLLSERYFDQEFIRASIELGERDANA